METPNTQKNDVGVMGVSRSGRVRKKSSKLMDFQSPDDIDTRHKKGASHKQKNTQNSGNTSGLNETFSQQHSQSNNQLGNNNNNANMFSPTNTKSDDEQLSSIEDFIPGENESFDSDIDIEDVAILDDEHDEPIDDENDSVVDPTVRRSIYMTEKVVQTKTQRKDKGKTRVTAYMLWARDVRKQMVAQQPDLDFATISRRLGEMWANVPISEKCVWKRRAKRLANTILKKNKEVTNSKSPSKFLNKGINANNKAAKKILQSDDNMYIQQQEQLPMNIECTTINLALPQSQSSKTSPIITPGIYKVTGIEPLDVAAHLKLLGDSLTIIGERLKEHEGQITVSGSLSVLLDSLLCSIGPLMCLTAQIRGLNDNRHLRESLRNTLDNIAYVMPGL